MSEPAGTKKHRLPATFRSLGPLRVLNVLALASALASATGSAFGYIFGHGEGTPMAATALSTFLFAFVWAILMRRRATIGSTKFRFGWIASIPLAAANAGTACGILFAHEGGEKFLAGFMLGATIGAMFWLPGLIAVLALYGYPIAKAQSMAEQGLAGEERGERIVGIVSVVIALIAALACPAEVQREMSSVLSHLGRPLVLSFAGAAGLCGLMAAALATYRDRVRRAFVKNVEAGAVQGFRVDATAAGKVLVRVSSQGGGYRAATFEEDVYGLDEAGAAGKALTSD